MAKVFISHSSKDKGIVLLFKEIILKSGIGLSDDDIFFTSSPETGVPIGENIPEYIKKNLKDCDYTFLMISENYKRSEVCLNEMGAAMVLGKKLIPVILYDYDFDKVGWLIDRSLCISIDDADRLHQMRDDLYDNGLKTYTSVWNRSLNMFLEEIASLNCIKEDGGTTKGYVDYQIAIEDSLNRYNYIYNTICEILQENISRINLILKDLESSRSLLEQKMFLGQIASRLNSMADHMEKNNDLVRDSVNNALDSVLAIFDKCSLSKIDKDSWQKSVLYFKGVTDGNMLELTKVKSNVTAFGDLEERQMEAKQRVIDCLDYLIDTCRVVIEKSNQVLSK